jgi:cyclopropane-fatty-acyl-phospholipid synthase
MATDSKAKTISKLLESADIKINGTRPWDIQVRNPNFYDAFFHGTSLTIGESYMRGDWDCDRIDELIYRLIQSNITALAKKDLRFIAKAIEARFMNVSRKSRAFEIAETHYNTGNDLFRAMLDKRMVYTCGYWKNAKNLDEAQEAKLDLVCRKIGLEKGMRVLDIGGGWGSFAKFAAEKYGAEVVNITVSKEQVALANELCKGLSVENRLQDYRDMNEQFDRIVSLGMFEHVGPKNYRAYMEVAKRNLKPQGLFLLHTIGSNITFKSPDPWLTKYIFPNSHIPSIQQIGHSAEGLFVIEDWHNFGVDYDKTLMEWYNNFEKGWLILKKNYSETFYRMWRLYLLSCAGSFRARGPQLWQIVLSPNGFEGGYQSIR